MCSQSALVPGSRQQALDSTRNQIAAASRVLEGKPGDGLEREFASRGPGGVASKVGPHLFCNTRLGSLSSANWLASWPTVSPSRSEAARELVSEWRVCSSIRLFGPCERVWWHESKQVAANYMGRARASVAAAGLQALWF